MTDDVLSTDEIRSIVLAEVKALADRGRERSVPPRVAIQSACEAISKTRRSPGDVRVLESFYALFNEGVLSWGLNRANPGMEHAHVTPLGETVLGDLHRDPANPSGFMGDVRPWIDEMSIAWGYVAEALHAYNSGCDRGAAVLLGCASEALVLDVRDALVARYGEVGVTAPKRLHDWKAKQVIDAIEAAVRTSGAKMPHDLAERFDVHWRSLFHHVRMARNEAGHPASVRPVERTTVHGSLLLFPSLARLAHDLGGWIVTSFEP